MQDGYHTLPASVRHGPSGIPPPRSDGLLPNPMVEAQPMMHQGYIPSVGPNDFSSMHNQQMITSEVYTDYQSPVQWAETIPNFYPQEYTNSSCPMDNNSNFPESSKKPQTANIQRRNVQKSKLLRDSHNQKAGAINKPNPDSTNIQSATLALEVRVKALKTELAKYKSAQNIPELNQPLLPTPPQKIDQPIQCARCGKPNHTANACQMICVTCGTLCRSFEKCQATVARRIPGQNCIRCNNPKHQRTDCTQKCPTCQKPCANDLHCQKNTGVRVCPICKQPGHQRRYCPTKVSKKCHRCQSLDHTLLTCPEKCEKCETKCMGITLCRKIVQDSEPGNPCSRCKSTHHHRKSCTDICPTCNRQCYSDEHCNDASLPTPPTAQSKTLSKCRHCKKNGHTDEQCKRVCQRCFRKGHTADGCWQKNSYKNGKNVKIDGGDVKDTPEEADLKAEEREKLRAERRADIKAKAIERRNNRLCKTCNKLGHMTKNCPDKYGAHVKEVLDKLFCDRCHRIGHIVEECHAFKTREGAKIGRIGIIPSDVESKGTAPKTICSKCGTECGGDHRCKEILEKSQPAKPCVRCSHPSHQRQDCTQPCSVCSYLCLGDEQCERFQVHPPVDSGDVARKETCTRCLRPGHRLTNCHAMTKKDGTPLPLTNDKLLRICKKCATQCPSKTQCRRITDKVLAGQHCDRCGSSRHQRRYCALICSKCSSLCYNDTHCEPEVEDREQTGRQKNITSVNLMVQTRAEILKKLIGFEEHPSLPCTKCGGVGHKHQTCPVEFCTKCRGNCINARACKKRVQAMVVCVRCGMKGHLAKKCGAEVNCLICGTNCKNRLVCEQMVAGQKENTDQNTYAKAWNRFSGQLQCTRCGQSNHEAITCTTICSNCGTMCKTVEMCQDIFCRRIIGDTCTRCGSSLHQRRDCSQTCKNCLIKCGNDVQCRDIQAQLATGNRFPLLISQPKTIFKKCNICQQPGHSDADCKAFYNEPRVQNPPVTTVVQSAWCSACQQAGHLEAECNAFYNENVAQNMHAMEVVCGICKHTGHLDADCQAMTADAQVIDGENAFCHNCLRKKVNCLCQKPSTNVEVAKPKRSKYDKNKKCGRCDRWGHADDNCHAPEFNKGKRRCEVCHGFGHKAYECSYRQEESNNESQAETLDQNVNQEVDYQETTDITDKSTCDECGTKCANPTSCEAIQDNSQPGQPCSICNHVGHQAIDCDMNSTKRKLPDNTHIPSTIQPNLIAPPKKKPKYLKFLKNMPCQICGKYGHSAPTCFHNASNQQAGTSGPQGTTKFNQWKPKTPQALESLTNWGKSFSNKALEPLDFTKDQDYWGGNGGNKGEETYAYEENNVNTSAWGVNTSSTALSGPTGVANAGQQKF